MPPFGYKKVANVPANIYDVMGLSSVGHYTPIMHKFFAMNETNADHITFPFQSMVKEFHTRTSVNIYEVDTFCEETQKEKRTEVFIKYTPLNDMVQYLTSNNADEQTVPTFTVVSNDPEKYFNNAAYIDGFFNYLSSLALHEHGILNAIDCHGLYLGMHNELPFNIIDDIDVLVDDNHFHKNKDRLYELGDTNSKYMKVIRNSRVLKPKINIEETTNENIATEDVEMADDVIGGDIVVEEEIIHVDDDVITDHNTESSSSCSSRTSNTRTNETLDSDSESSNEGSESSSDSESKGGGSESKGGDSEGGSDSEGDSEGKGKNHKRTMNNTQEEDEYFYVNIYNMPSQIIVMEKCEGTLDSLLQLDDDEYSDKEINAMLAQVILTLAAFQKMFKFTHNDLHCNNIMYVKTEKPYLYYCFNKVYYKIPTYGRIYKIIDFGRSIYTFKSKLCMGDCFKRGAVASNQFNYGPYYMDDKPEIGPNYSFDLCRFACSIFDCLVDFEDDYNTVKCPIKKLIMKWCMDDNGKSMLYKKNGVERYPDFKLYKMITRVVHQHTPENAIQDTIFKKYVVTHASINKKNKPMNIDRLPELWR